MEPSELFIACLEQASRVVKQVTPRQFANATPDSEWNVRDLVEHMLYELLFVPDLLNGKTIAEIGSLYEGELIDEDAIDLSYLWQRAADKAEYSAEMCDPDETAHLSYGEVSVSDYLQEVATDMLIHAWDLGKAIGVPVTFDTTVATLAYQNALPKEKILHSSELFGEQISVAKDASIQTRLLGLFGRRADWRAM
jgi:uncharacterized protein (TIGR03086 family)